MIRPEIPRSPRSSDAGFVLIEMLVAMAVGAFLLVALASVTAFTLRAHARAAAQAADLENASRILATLSHEIRSAAWIRWSGEKPSLIFAGGRDRILFARDNPSTAGLQATQVVSIESLPSKEGMRLVRSVARLVPSARSAQDLAWSISDEVYRGRYRLSFAYFITLEHGEALVDDWTQSDVRPVAVRLSLTAMTAGDETISIRVPLLIDSEPGCALRTSRPCMGDPKAAEADLADEGGSVDADDAEGWARYGR